MEKNIILVVGSLAYDNLMTFDGEFRDVIVPGNFNLALNASGRTISFGGCAGNIAYNLRLLEQNPLIVTAVGNDFAPYRDRLTQLGIDVSAVYVSDQHLTASAFIVTDRHQNQITIFDAGAMNVVQPIQKIHDLQHSSIAWAIISPDNPERMIRAARECNELNIPYMFDPSQQIHTFKTEDLRRAIENCSVLVANKYESGLLAQKLGITHEALSSMIQNFIETDGSNGCNVRSPDGVFYIKAVQPSVPADPTGCGDAFRAGVLMGLMQKFTIQKSCRIGALVATYNIEKNGTQSHHFTLPEFSRRFQDNFGDILFTNS